MLGRLTTTPNTAIRRNFIVIVVFNSGKAGKRIVVENDLIKRKL